MSKVSRATTILAKRALPSKEAALFKDVLTMYETRQLKKGLKTADQILKKYPEHGETMCMKGLILAHMGRREEGIELVKKGVRLDLTSHICWHVFGLIQKGEKNYEEALKSYTQALRFDKDNMNILRDAASLQCQLRLYDGLVETRHTILRIRPTLRQNWVALSVAYYLNGNMEEAKNVLEHYESTLKNVPHYDVEHSETTAYHVKVLEDLGQYSDALSFLDTNSKSRVIVDKTTVMEMRARLLSKLKSEEAEHAWRVLIDHNPHCTDYYRGYLASQNISADEAAVAVLKEVTSQLPKANAHRRLALNYASGDEFKTLAREYLLAAFKKGIPSLFADIKPLYSNGAKLEAIQSIVETLATDNAPNTGTPSSSTTSSEPSMYLWILYFQAQHLSYLQEYPAALDVLEKAIAHTPTLPELYTCRARVLKRAGNPYMAARSVEEARLLDGQDRFLNTKGAKYYLRAGLIDDALSLLGLFTKKDAVSPSADLEDMQSLLYLIEEADAQQRLGKYNLALKKYVAIQKIFDEIEDDQYDFHGYSMRKFTVNIYLSLLTWEDQLRSHPVFIRTAIAASKILVSVYDQPGIVTQLSTPSGQLTSAAKKAQKKAKKAAQKTQEDVKKAATQTNEDKGLEPNVNKDEDPEGLKLLACSDPLERAARFLQPLVNLEIKDVQVWIAVYDVAIRRKKYLQAIKALLFVRSIDAANPELHVRLAHLHKTVKALPQEPPSPIGPVFMESVKALISEEVSIEALNSQYLQTQSSNPFAVLAAAKVLHLLEGNREEVDNTVFATLGPNVTLTLKAAQELLAFLTDIKSSRSEEYRIACDARFPLATIFKTAEEQSLLAKQAVNIPIAHPVDDVEA